MFLLDNLPDSLKSLQIRTYFNSIDYLPPSLLKLDIEDFIGGISTFIVVVCARPLSSQLRPDYKFSGLRTHFNFILGAVDYLPPSLLHLKLGKAFNMPIDYLPPTLKTLTIGDNFGQDIDHLPANLEGIVRSQVVCRP